MSLDLTEVDTRIISASRDELANGIEVKVIADSISEFGCRITTIECRYPRFIHSEIMTHRDRARNSASSRAIPWPKMCERICNDPVVPIVFGTEQKGMQTGDFLEGPQEAEARTVWLQARQNAIESAIRLANLGVHKSIVNRLTEPFMWITVVMTATNWKNLFRLRVHPDAEIHFQNLAAKMRDEITSSVPNELQFGEWHLPYVPIDELGTGRDLAKASTARCARVSYLTHDGKPNFKKDVELFERLCQGSGFGHWSPHEHPAVAVTPDVRSGPYRGWIQFRKFFTNECAD